MKSRICLLACLMSAILPAKDHITNIEIFGYAGMDVDAIRRSLPVKPGDPVTRDVRTRIRAAVRTTNVAVVCCVDRGDSVIFIGLPGASSKVFEPAASPIGDAKPPSELARLYRQMDEAETTAFKRGHFQTEGGGFRVIKDDEAKAAELAVHSYALEHEDEIVHVLETSSSAEYRALAADSLGYGARTKRQLEALVRAGRDPDEAVRNNATRALSEIIDADSSVSSQIAPDTFIDLIRSGIWTDRNKGAAVLMGMVKSKDPKLLERLEKDARPALEEMSRWKNEGWAGSSQVILSYMNEARK